MEWSLGPGVAQLATVIVTGYNQAWVLPQTLASVSAQSYRPLQCVIVDDGSSDGTPEVVARFQADCEGDIDVRPILQSNKGAQEARNAGVRASSGSYIQFLDGDDVLDPDKLRKQIEFFTTDAGKECDSVYGYAKWLHDDEEGLRDGEVVGVGATDDILATLLSSETFNAPFSYLSKRVAVEQTGPWNSTLEINDDVDYFLRMACSCLARSRNFGYLPVMTGFYRRHDRPRMSDGGRLRRARCNLRIYKALQTQATESHLLTARRAKALARAFYNVSCWASGLDNSIWSESLDHALRLDPHVPPDRSMTRGLHKLVGVKRAERLLRTARGVRRRNQG